MSIGLFGLNTLICFRTFRSNQPNRIKYSRFFDHVSINAGTMELRNLLYLQVFECVPVKQSRRFPCYLFPSAGLKFADVPNGLAAISKVPAAGLYDCILYEYISNISYKMTRVIPKVPLGHCHFDSGGIVRTSLQM